MQAMPFGVWDETKCMWALKSLWQPFQCLVLEREGFVGSSGVIGADNDLTNFL